MAGGDSMCLRCLCQSLNVNGSRSMQLNRWLLHGAQLSKARDITSSPLRQQRRFASSDPAHKNTSKPQIARLNHRRLLAVHGQDAAHFLQGLTTNNVPTTLAASGRDGFYSAFLNAQGRLLHDVFIYPASASQFYRDRLLTDAIRNKKSEEDPGFVVEADAEGIQALYKHLRRYKLRAKVDLWVLDEGQASLLGAFGGESHISRDEQALRTIDTRAPGFGTRIVAEPSSDYEKSLFQQFEEAPLSQYHQSRHTVGIAEGQVEMPYAASLPHETNVDLMGGVDFRKGCYVGQELTIRTQHKGVVRKRIVPVSLYSTDSGQSGDLVKRVQEWTDAGASVDILPNGRKGRPAGRWVGGVSQDNANDIGLAMCRLEMMTDVVVEAGGDGGGVRFKEGDEFVLRPKWEDGRKEESSDICVRAHVPAWLREGIEARTKRGGNDRALDSSGFHEEAATASVG